MATHVDADWDLPEKIDTWELVKVALLMDIRRELKWLNRLLSCRNFTDIPHTLAAIKRNTTKCKPKRKGA